MTTGIKPGENYALAGYNPADGLPEGRWVYDRRRGVQVWHGDVDRSDPVEETPLDRRRRKERERRRRRRAEQAQPILDQEAS